jgi:hypothetical protein
MFSVSNLATSGETPFLAHWMKKWLTAADIRREIVTGLQAWFEQTDNTLEAAAVAEDAYDVVIRMGKEEDDPDGSDSDYNSIDAERDAQKDDDDEGKPHPKPKVLLKYSPHTTGLTSVEAISIRRVGLRVKKSSTETQDTTDRSSQAINMHPSLSGSNGRPLTRSGSNDARNY